MDCKEVDKFLQVYVDGELDDEDRVLVEEHLRSCPRCRAMADYEQRFIKSIKARFPREEAPAELRSRLVHAMAQVPERKPLSRRLVWGSVPAAAALALVITFTWTVTSGFSPLVDDAIQQHSTEPPVEVNSSDTSAVENWFRKKVDFNVALPRFPRAKINLVGARLSHLAERQAALVRYKSRGRHFSLFVLTDTGDKLTGKQCRRVKSREFCLTEQKGYTVVLWRSRGLVYSLVGDWSPSEMMKVLASESSF